MSAEEKKQDLVEMFSDFASLSREDQLKTWGFALGLKAQEEHHPG